MQSLPATAGATDTTSLEPFEALPVVARIESDSYCAGCGYNLRGQAVRRDPRTAILLCRCCECGRYREAERNHWTDSAWLQRVGRVALGVWILALLGAIIMLGVFQLALIVEGSSFIRRSIEHQRSPTQHSWVPSEAEIRAMKIAWALASAGLGYGACLLATIAVPHWRRWGYLALSLACPLLAMGAAAFIVYFDSRSELWWVALWTTYSFTIPFAIIGGIVAVFTGRPLARLLTTLFVTSRIRPMLDYLWRADGLELPKAEPKPKR